MPNKVSASSKSSTTASSSTTIVDNNSLKKSLSKNDDKTMNENEEDELLDYEEEEEEQQNDSRKTSSSLSSSSSSSKAKNSSSFSLAEAKIAMKQKQQQQTSNSASSNSLNNQNLENNINNNNNNAANHVNNHNINNNASNSNSSNNSISGTTSKIKGTYSSIHSSGFRDFILRPELMKSIANCGFEHPSTVQHETIPQAILGMDILCQAKSGMGKTAVFVISTLQLLNPKQEETSVLVIAHTRELALQISKEYERFSQYLPVKVHCFLGGIPISKDLEILGHTNNNANFNNNNNNEDLNNKTKQPHIVVGTPGRLLALIERKALKLHNLKHFVIDEADKVLSELTMRSVVQKIFKSTPREKQTMMFSATMPKEMQELCRKFMQDPLEVTIDDDTQLTLHGLHQYYVELEESAKSRHLIRLLDALEFNQVIIFVASAQRCVALSRFLTSQNFPTCHIHGKMTQSERLAAFSQFKQFQSRLLVATDLCGRGIDVARVTVVIQYDMAADTDTYLHRVGRAGRFGTRGVAISFLSRSNVDDFEVMKSVQKRFEVKVKAMPDKLDRNSYMEVLDNDDNNNNNGGGNDDNINNNNHDDDDDDGNNENKDTKEDNSNNNDLIYTPTPDAKKMK